MKTYRYPAIALLLLAAACGARTTNAPKTAPQPETTTLEASPQRKPAPAHRLADTWNDDASTFRPGSVSTLRGRVVIAHEVRSFTPEGDSTEYWIVDPTGALEREYDRATRGFKNGKPVDAELTLRYKGPSDEGFAAEYAGVFEVEAIRSMKPSGK